MYARHVATRENSRMTHRRSLISIAGLGVCGLFIISCTGILEPLGGGGGQNTPDAGPAADGAAGETPQALFLNTVRDRLAAKCAGCHYEGGTSPDFLTASADNYYDRLMAGYPSELIGTSANASAVYVTALSPHLGQQWSEDDQAALTAWIDAEYAYRTNQDGGGGDPVEPPPGTGDDCTGLNDADCALKNFGTCFDYDRWNEMQAYAVADNQSSQGDCKGCHFDGKGGFWASNDSLEMYQKWKQVPYVQKLVEAAIDGNGEFAGLIEAHRIEDKSGEPGHPSYSLQSSAQAVNDFVRDTLQDYNTGGCTDDPGQ